MNTILKIYKVIIILILVCTLMLSCAYAAFLYMPLGRTQAEKLKFTDDVKPTVEYNHQKYIKVDAQTVPYASSLGFGVRFGSFIPALKKTEEVHKIEQSDTVTAFSKYEKEEYLGYFAADDVVLYFPDTKYSYNLELVYDVYFNESLFAHKELTAGDIEKISILKGLKAYGDIQANDAAYNKLETKDYSFTAAMRELTVDFICRQSFDNSECVKTLESEKDIKSFYSSLESDDAYLDYYLNLWTEFKTKNIYYKVDLKDSPLCLYAFPMEATRKDLGGTSEDIPDNEIQGTEDSDVIRLTDCERIGIIGDEDGYNIKISGKNISSTTFVTDKKLYLVLFYNGEDHYIEAEYENVDIVCYAGETFEQEFKVYTDGEETEILDSIFDNGDNPKFSFGKTELKYS